MRKTLTILVTTVLALGLTFAMAETTFAATSAKAMPSSFLIEDSSYLTTEFVIDQQGYARVEDVCYAARGTDKCAKVVISEGTIAITTGQKQSKTSKTFKAYKFKASMDANTASVTLNGASRTEKAYIIDGAAYMKFADIGVMLDMAVSVDSPLNAKFYKIKNPANISQDKKGVISKDLEEGVYLLQCTYAKNRVITVSYGSVAEKARIVLGDYKEGTYPPEKQLFVLRKYVDHWGSVTYSFENMRSRKLIHSSKYYPGTYPVEQFKDDWARANSFILRKGDSGGMKICVEGSAGLGTSQNKKDVGSNLELATDKNIMSVNFVRI